MKITSFSLLCEWLYQERAWVRQCAVTLAEEYASYGSGGLYSALRQHGFAPMMMARALEDEGPKAVGEHFDRLAGSGFDVLIFTVPLFGLGQGLMGRVPDVDRIRASFCHGDEIYGRIERFYYIDDVPSSHPAWFRGREAVKLSEDLRGQLSLVSSWAEICEGLRWDWVYLRESLRLVKHLSEGGRKLPQSVVNYIQDKGILGSLIRPSTEDPAQWVFTASAEHGVADRQTRMRPGKLLRRLLPEEPEVVIQAVATAYTQGTALYSVKFADTREEIRRVYEEGPNSCMSKCVDEYSTWDDIHPSEVYAGPDTKLAYIEDFSGNITARAVVVPSKKAWVRIYGNAAGLEPALGALGYEQSSEALCGCRLLLLQRGDRAICPYLDGDYDCVAEDTGYLVVGSYGAEADAYGIVNLKKVKGYEYDEDRRECDNCGDYENYEEGECLLSGESNNWVCRGCLDHSNHVVHGYINGNATGYMWRDDATWIEVLESHVLASVLDRAAGLAALGIVWSYHGEDYILASDAVELADGSCAHKDDSALCAVSRQYHLVDESSKLWDGKRYVHDDLLDSDEVPQLSSLSACPLGFALADEAEVFEAPDGSDCTMLKAEMVELDGAFYRMCDLTLVVDGNNNLSWRINDPLAALRFTRPAEAPETEAEVEEALAA